MPIPEDKSANNPHSTWGRIYWWMFLVVAVLAVPSLGFIFAAMASGNSLAQVVVFIFSCWFCTFLGMKLMQK